MIGKSHIVLVVAVFAGALFAPGMAYAADPALKCDDPQTQVEINICAAEAYKKADAELNKQWTATAAVMAAQDKAAYAPKDGGTGYYPALLAAQRAWIKFRDLECRIEGYAMRGGTGESMVISACLAAMTQERTKQLKDMAANYGR